MAEVAIHATKIGVFSFASDGVEHQIANTRCVPGSSLLPGFPHGGPLQGSTRPKTAGLSACQTRHGRPPPPLWPSCPRRVPRRQWPGKQHARRGHHSPPLSLVAASPAADVRRQRRSRGRQFRLGALKHFHSVGRLNIASANPYDAQARAASPLPPSPSPYRAPEPQENKGTRTMTMISEKAIALLLAVALSGTAFNTFIV